jgi:hypothetical protein
VVNIVTAVVNIYHRGGNYCHRGGLQPWAWLVNREVLILPHLGLIAQLNVIARSSVVAQWNSTVCSSCQVIIIIVIIRSASCPLILGLCSFDRTAEVVTAQFHNRSSLDWHADMRNRR